MDALGFIRLWLNHPDLESRDWWKAFDALHESNPDLYWFAIDRALNHIYSSPKLLAPFTRNPSSRARVTLILAARMWEKGLLYENL